MSKKMQKRRGLDKLKKSSKKFKGVLYCEDRKN